MPRRHLRAARLLVLSSCAVFPIAACGGGDAGTSPGKSTPTPATVRVEYAASEPAVGAAGTTLGAPVVLTATDAAGRPLAGRTVSWFVSRQASRVTGDLTTDADGRATARWTLDTIAGVDTLRARVDQGVPVALGATITPGAPVRVALAPTTVTLVSLGDAVALEAEGADRYGNAVPSTAYAWTSSDASVAPVTRYADGSMHVTAAHGGTAYVRATAGDTVADSVRVVVAQVVAKVAITLPRRAMLVAGDTFSLRSVARDVGGSVAPLPLAWQSSNTSVLTVDAAGVVTARGAGSSLVRASRDQGIDTVTIVVAPAGPALVADTVATGRSPHACALVGGVAWCWGWNGLGQLGRYTTLPNGDPDPAPVLGSTRFSSISTGFQFTCGLTAAGVAWCWGDNTLGQVGVTGSPLCDRAGDVCEVTPRAAATDLVFRAIALGADHACALATDGRAWCWGANRYGQLGAGPIDTLAHATPTLAAGGQTFAAIAAGEDFTCGLSPAGVAYCWGSDDQRQLGSVAGEVACMSPFDTLYRCTSSPVAVPGVPALAAIAAGKNYACGLTAAGAAWCWGSDNYGQLGDGLRTFSSGNAATPVLGGHAFSSIAPGMGTTCALALDARAWCWGYPGNGSLGLGDGESPAVQSTPQLVYGDRRYRVVVGGGTSCAVTAADDAVLCWGDGSFGTLGTGVKGASSIPVRVRRP